MLVRTGGDLLVPGCRQEMQGVGGPSRGESRGGRHPEMIPYCRETGRCEESLGRADSPRHDHCDTGDTESVRHPHVVQSDTNQI